MFSFRTKEIYSNADAGATTNGRVTALSLLHFGFTLSSARFRDFALLAIINLGLTAN